MKEHDALKLSDGGVDNFIQEPASNEAQVSGPSSGNRAGVGAFGNDEWPCLTLKRIIGMSAPRMTSSLMRKGYDFWSSGALLLLKPS